MDQTRSRAKQVGTFLKPLLKTKPNTGHLWIDVTLLVLLGAFQFAVLNSLFGRFIIVDLLTPWLVIGFIVQPLPYTILLAFIGAMLLETHSSAPAGLYICTYWMIAVVINLCRTAFSWQHLLPWFATLAAAQAWVIAFETLVLYVNSNVITDPHYILMQLGRFILSVGIGLWLFRTKLVEMRKDTAE